MLIMDRADSQSWEDFQMAKDKAKHQVGHTPEQRARWLLDFCRKDISTQEPDERLQLEWAMFLGTDPLQKQAEDGSTFWHRLPSQNQVTSWQSNVNKKLLKLAKCEPWILDVKADHKLFVQNGVLKSETSLKTEDHWPALFQVMETLTALGDRFRFCLNKTCYRPFIRTKRQRFCSSRCREIDIKRRYRQKKKTQTSNSN